MARIYGDFHQASRQGRPVPGNLVPCPIHRVGGRLHGFWYAFGDADGYVLGELPDDVVAASTLTKVAASGAFTSVATTKLLSVEEMLAALRGAGGVQYRAPGATSDT